MEGYRALKSQFGLMDYSDQISLAARLAEEQPQVGELERDGSASCCSTSTRTPRWRRRRCSSKLFSGAEPDQGRGHAVTAVGDPNQAIYGWRGASVSNILNFAQTFPARDGATVPVLSLTVNRRSDRRILQAANALALPLYEAADGRAAAAQPDAADGRVGVHVFETQDDELQWLTEVVRPRPSRTRGPTSASWRVTTAPPTSSTP